ncbi:MAG: hypothetical protein ACR2JE_09310 [Acidobacteriaceae bacterium]
MPTRLASRAAEQRETAGPRPGSSPAQAASDDGTRMLLRTGGWTLLVGLLAALATRTIFGGVTTHGPHTNAGWLGLIVAMMCLPFGSLLFLLGGAKWLRNRRLARHAHLK